MAAARGTSTLRGLRVLPATRVLREVDRHVQLSGLLLPRRTGREPGGTWHAALSALASRPAWVVVAVVAVVALAVGSVHPAQANSAAHIAHLDSLI